MRNIKRVEASLEIIEQRRTLARRKTSTTLGDDTKQPVQA